jgi:hypothetical protein
MSQLITKLNFPTAYKEFKDRIIVFGVPAQEILTGKRIPLIQPSKYLLDGDGAAIGSIYDVNEAG